MAITVKRITLWRTEVRNQPGKLAGALGPLAAAGADLEVVMGYRYPGDERQAAIEVYPVTGRRMSAAAEIGGLQPAKIPVLLVQGDNRSGLGYAIARALSESSINLAFVIAQVIGRTYSAVIGFDNETDAKRAVPMIKRATAVPRARDRARLPPSR